MNGHSHAPRANLWLELTRMSAGRTLPAIRQDRKKPLMFRDLISHVRTRSATAAAAGSGYLDWGPFAWPERRAGRVG